MLKNIYASNVTFLFNLTLYLIINIVNKTGHVYSISIEINSRNRRDKISV